MPQRKGLTSPQNNFLDTIATRFDGTHSNFVLGNAQSRDNPIVYCSDGFVELTGFPRVHIMTKSCSCNFLWGEETDKSVIDTIMECLQNKSELKTEVFFYKKDGTSFLCLLDIVPIKNEKDQVVLFLVSHKNLSDIGEVGHDSDDIEANEHDGSRSDDDEHSGEDPDSHHHHSSNIATSDQYKRRRSRAVLYQLSGQYKKKKSRFFCFHLKEFGGHHKRNQVPEFKVNETTGAKSCIVLHYSLFKIIWDWLILLCTFYIAIFVPYNVTFVVDREVFFLDIVVEVLFFVDIFLNFRTTFVSKGGQVIYIPRHIAINYLRGWFFLDLIAATPFELLSYYSSLRNEMQMMKLARLLRLVRLIQKIDRYAQYSFVLLALLICAFALCAHWLACIWYLIGRNEFKANATRSINWLYDLSEKIGIHTMKEETISQSCLADVLNCNISVRSIYISSLYFTCTTITSVGFGNVYPTTDSEKIFSICTMLIGALMHAAIFGNVTAIIQRMYSRKTHYQTRNQDLKDFTKVHHIPKTLKQRMFEFFQTNWAINRGIEPQEILKDFPEEMRGEISLHLNKEIMCLEMFEKATNSCKKSLAQQIKTLFATPTEYLFYRGDSIKYLYLICSGSIEILDNRGECICLLGKFDLFGPANVEFRTRSNFDVRALSYCEIQCLKLDCLGVLFDEYPEFRNHFVKSILYDLSFNVARPIDSHKNFSSIDSSYPGMEMKHLNHGDNLLQDTPEYIYLPAISEREEETKSDDDCDNTISDVELQKVDDAGSIQLNNPEVLIKNSINPICHPEFATKRQYSLEQRRQSYQYPTTSYASRYKGRPRSASLPLCEELPIKPEIETADISTSSLLTTQLTQLSASSLQLSNQICSMQKCVDQLSQDVRYLFTIVQNNPQHATHTSTSHNNRHNSISSSSSSLFIQNSPNCPESSPRVKFDLKPKEIITTSNYDNNINNDDAMSSDNTTTSPDHSLLNCQSPQLGKRKKSTDINSNTSSTVNSNSYFSKRIGLMKQKTNSSKLGYSILSKRSASSAHSSANSIAQNNTNNPEQIC